jgi:hypothetical protein
MKKVYISGPISNQPNLNREAFYQEAERIRDMGNQPVNPHEICAITDQSYKNWECMTDDQKWKAYMVTCISTMLELNIDAIHLLPGWENSRGAVIEEMIAEALNIERVVV